jgi:hypothetical protein
MATISNTPRPGYVWDATDNVWYPIGVGGHGHPDYITQATAVNPTIIDAKGDIITATAADTPARLAVGNNGETLVADSAATTGLRYSATPSASNPVLNSAFQIWQRGTSVAFGAYTYTADRWQAYNNGSVGTASQQVTGDTTNLPNIQYCARIQRTSGSSLTNAIQFSQSFETINSIQYAGKTVTLSFYARKGANYSPTSDILHTTLYYGTGTDQRVLAGYTGGTAAINQNTTLTSTWQRFSYSGSIASTATEVGIAFNFNPTGTAGANDYYEITGVQIDIGSVALPFRTYAATIQGELAACQRYYQRITSLTAGLFSTFGTATSSTQVALAIPLVETMRVTPTSIESANVGVSDFVGSTVNATSVVFQSATMKDYAIVYVNVASGLTQYRPYLAAAQTGTVAYLGFSAEL